MSVPKDVLDDLAGRFITNLPEEEREDPVRLCFQAERAHWFYIDNLNFYAEQRSANCPRCGIRDFIKQIFQHCSFLQRYGATEIDGILEKWREYKGGIPTYGAILLDKSMDNVLLVKGYHSKASWGFPKGKANEEELPHNCAIREVKEETGFDITPLIKENEYLERHMVEQQQLNRLYIVAGVPHDYDFKPTTRNEIKECRWFSLDALPSSKMDNTKTDLGIYPTNFYMVFPYVDQLRRWVSNRRGPNNRNDSIHTTPITNGDHHRHFQQQLFDQRRQNRSSPRTRTASASHSSPTFYNADLSKQHTNNSFSSADKNARYSASSKQQQQQPKKTRKASSRQKLEFGTAVECTPKSESHQWKQQAGKDGHADTSTTEEKTAVVRVDIQPCQAWQQFKFNWESVLAVT